MAIVLEYKPLDPQIGLYGPFLTQRVLKFATEYETERDAPLLTRQFMARVMAGDPAVKLFMVVDEVGQPVGHAVATYEKHGDKSWVYCWQCEVDGKQDGAVAEMIAQLEHWGSEYGAHSLIMTTHRNEKAWQKKYSFTTRHAVMSRAIPQKRNVMVGE